VVNHIRNLLLNQSGAVKPRIGAKGAEYIEPHFIARQLTPALQRFFTALYGRTPDDSFRNYRIWQVMSFLGRTYAVQHALEFADRRISYDRNPAWLETFESLDVYGPSSGKRLLVTDRGTTADTAAGQALFNFDLEVTRGTDGLLWLTVNGTPTELLHDHNGRSQEFTLPAGAGELRVILRNVELDDRYIVVLCRRPPDDFQQTVQTALGALGALELDSMLSVDTPPLPWLREFYKQTSAQTEQQAAALLAIAYTIERLPQDG